MSQKILPNQKKRISDHLKSLDSNSGDYWQATKEIRKELKLDNLPSGDQPSLLIED